MRSMKAYGALCAFFVLVYFVVFHWGRFLSDFWPLDKSSVGPNLLASAVQWGLIAIVVALVYPPARRAVERYLRRHVDEIKGHVSVEHAKLHDKIDASHRLLHHVIVHSPKIPNEVPGLDTRYQPKGGK